MAQNAKPSHSPDITEEDLSVLAELTEKQVAFVTALLEGKANIEAYRLAYDAQNMGDASVSVEAARLKHSPKVALAISLLRLAGVSGQVIRSREQYVSETEALKEGALKAGQWTAARGFHEIIGKVEGHLIDRIKDETPRESLADILHKGEELFGEAWTTHPLYKQLEARMQRH